MFTMVEDPQPYTSLKVFELFTPSLCGQGIADGISIRSVDKLAGDLIRTVALNRHGKDALDHFSGFVVYQPLVSGFSFQK